MGKGIIMGRRKQWFEIGDEGTGSGTKFLEQRAQNLDVIKDALGDHDGVTLLDVGCVEGCIGAWVVDNNSKDSTIHGIERNENMEPRFYQFMETQGLKEAKFWCHDMNLDPPRGLLEQYDVVLLLAVAHKLRNPKSLIQLGMEKAKTWLAIRVPIDEDIPGENYINKEHKELHDQFEVVHHSIGEADEWKRPNQLYIFKRKS